LRSGLGGELEITQGAGRSVKVEREMTRKGVKGAVLSGPRGQILTWKVRLFGLGRAWVRRVRGLRCGHVDSW
jgi:hypothetical protein